MTTIEKLKKFITNNGLTFEEGCRNSNCVLICGYYLFISNEDDINEIWDAIPEEAKTAELEDELFRVFNYASMRNYGKWWENEANRNQYKL